MTFMHWEFLFLLLVVPPAVWFSRRRAGTPSLRYSSTMRLTQPRRSLFQRMRWLLPALRVAALGLLVVALARPRQGVGRATRHGEGIGILMVVDRSGSMGTKDFELDGQRSTRLEAVKRVFQDFVDLGGELPGRPSDLVGLETFARYADIQSPLTLDHTGLLEDVAAVEVVTVRSEDGTAIGDAIVWGIERLKQAKTLKPASRVMILLTDGQSNTGVTSPVEAARLAAGVDIRVYTIGVGGELQEVRDPFLGTTMLVRSRDQVDEATLRQIATITKGKFFRAKDTESLMDIYRDIDKLEKSKTETTVYLSYNELFAWFAVPGILCLLLEQLLAATRFRCIP